MFKYSIYLFWNEADQGYVATIDEFPGLSAFGETPEEATMEARIAAEGFFKVMEEDGESIPVPKTIRKVT